MVMAKMMNSKTNWLESASPTAATPPQPSQHPYCYDHHRVQNDTCFNCGQRGHWAYQCPLKTPSPSSSPNPNTSKSTPSPSSSSPIPLSDYPAISCPLCQATCTVKVSQTERNRHRKYYNCLRQKVCFLLFSSSSSLLSLLGFAWFFSVFYLSLFHYSVNGCDFGFEFFFFSFLTFYFST